MSVRIGFPPFDYDTTPPLRIHDKRTRKSVLDELSNAVAMTDPLQKRTRLKSMSKDLRRRDVEIAVSCLWELGRAHMALNEFVSAAKCLCKALHLHDKYFYADASLLNDFAVSLMLLDDPYGWRFAYCALVLASRIQNTNVIENNIHTVISLLTRLEKN